MSEQFRHIYIEKRALDWPRTGQILRHFPGAEQILIDHYKDVFNRRRQDVGLQINHRSLILAVRQGEAVYPGAPVCQSFGRSHFYYASSVMNCPFNCEYCYLKGMYPSGNIVIFVNLEEIMEEVDRLLTEHPVYLCVSYDTDLLALEAVTGYVSAWADFAADRPGLSLEVRTKAALLSGWDHYRGRKDLIFAWTLSPETYIRQMEMGAASLTARLKSVRAAVEAGATVRLALDPMIFQPGWKKAYADLVDRIFTDLSPGQIMDVSIGSFRVSADYLKRLRRNQPLAASVQFPFVTEGGYCHYPAPLLEEMESFLREKLLAYVEDKQIFSWEEGIGTSRSIEEGLGAGKAD